jgi:enoyl-CoA hydratase/carnithine racemase
MFIKIEIIDQVGILTIDRQDALNAMNPQVLRELDLAVKTFIADKNVGVIILTGA